MGARPGCLHELHVAAQPWIDLESVLYSVKKKIKMATQAELNEYYEAAVDLARRSGAVSGFIIDTSSRRVPP